MNSHRLVSAVIMAALTTTVAIPQAHSQQTESNLPYVYSNYTFPPTRSTTVRHTLRLAVPANSRHVTALKFTAPAGFTLNRDVEVNSNQTGEKLPVDINLDRQTVEISFKRPIAPGTKLDVNLNNVNVWGLSRHYDVAVKFAGDNLNASRDKLQVSDNSQYIDLGKADLRRH